MRGLAGGGNLSEGTSRWWEFEWGSQQVVGNLSEGPVYFFNFIYLFMSVLYLFILIKLFTCVII